MGYNPNIHHKRSIRLQGYDYSQSGFYFVTICCHDRKHCFGKIENGIMLLNDAGKIADEYFKNLSVKYTQTKLHEYVVMPNHVHVIIEITEMTDGSIPVGLIHESNLLQAQPQPPLLLRDKRRKMLLPKIIGWYKMNTAKHINILQKTQGTPFWQRDYFEHIIRNEISFQKISNYIINNPIKWGQDNFRKS